MFLLEKLHIMTSLKKKLDVTSKESSFGPVLNLKTGSCTIASRELTKVNHQLELREANIKLANCLFRRLTSRL